MVMETLVSDDDCDTDENNGVVTVDIIGEFGFILPASCSPE